MSAAPEESTDSAPGEKSSIRFIGGSPTPEEIAAVVAVLSTQGAPEQQDPRPPSLWNDKSRLAAALHTPGPGAWRGSALPGLRR